MFVSYFFRWIECRCVIANLGVISVFWLVRNAAAVSCRPTLIRRSFPAMGKAYLIAILCLLQLLLFYSLPFEALQAIYCLRSHPIYNSQILVAGLLMMAAGGSPPGGFSARGLSTISFSFLFDIAGILI